jgi:hypothetical protein
MLEAIVNDYNYVKKSQETVFHIHIFPELPSVLTSTFYYFEPDNDFAIRYM